MNTLHILLSLILFFALANARVGITEFYNSTQGDGWVELYNSGPLPVNLRNYYISDVFGNSLFFTFDDRFINCGEYVVATNNIQQFQNDFLIQGDSQLIEFSGDFSRLHPQLLLFSPSGPVSRITLSDDAEQGASLYLADNNLDIFPAFCGGTDFQIPGAIRAGIDPCSGTIGYESQLSEQEDGIDSSAPILASPLAGNYQSNCGAEEDVFILWYIITDRCLTQAGIDSFVNDLGNRIGSDDIRVIEYRGCLDNSNSQVPILVLGMPGFAGVYDTLYLVDDEIDAGAFAAGGIIGSSIAFSTLPTGGTVDIDDTDNDDDDDEDFIIPIVLAAIILGLLVLFIILFLRRKKSHHDVRPAPVVAKKVEEPVVKERVHNDRTTEVVEKPVPHDSRGYIPEEKRETKVKTKVVH